jgi:hypothetical protein
VLVFLCRELGELLLDLSNIESEIGWVDASNACLDRRNINRDAGAFNALPGCFWFVIDAPAAPAGGLGESDGFVRGREKVQPQRN